MVTWAAFNLWEGMVFESLSPCMPSYQKFYYIKMSFFLFIFIFIFLYVGVIRLMYFIFFSFSFELHERGVFWDLREVQALA